MESSVRNTIRFFNTPQSASEITSPGIKHYHILSKARDEFLNQETGSKEFWFCKF